MQTDGIMLAWEACQSVRCVWLCFIGPVVLHYIHKELIGSELLTCNHMEIVDLMTEFAALGLRATST